MPQVNIKQKERKINSATHEVSFFQQTSSLTDKPKPNAVLEYYANYDKYTKKISSPAVILVLSHMAAAV